MKIKTCSDTKHPSRKSSMKVSLINIRSVRNKVDWVKDFIGDSGCDIIILVETWLSPGEKDNTIIASLLPSSYKIYHQPRMTGRGGGVALIYKAGINIKQQTTTQFRFFEHMEVLFHSTTVCYHFVTVYRPPPSGSNALTTSGFLSEFSILLEQLSLASGDTVLVGDFHFHYENMHDNSANNFRELVESFNLTQHVTEPTHVHGHILDLVFTTCKSPQSPSDTIHSIYVNCNTGF